MDIKDAKEIIAEKKIETVVLGVVDHNGILRGKQIPVENFITICEQGCGISTGAFIFDYTDFPWFLVFLCDWVGICRCLDSCSFLGWQFGLEAWIARVGQGCG